MEEEEWPNWPAPPGRVKVGHRYFDVLPLDPLEAAQNGAEGLANASGQYVKIKPDVGPGYAVELMVHELTHIIWRTNGTSPGTTGHTPRDWEESVATLVGMGMAGVLVDNPDLLQWIEQLSAQEVTGERADG